MITLTTGEFIALENLIGAMETDGSEEFTIKRFADGELGLGIARNGERGTVCRLSD